MAKPRSPDSASGASRITQLDGLRGIAIAMVFLHHAYRAVLLWMGVDLFFVMSGFLITGILMNQKNKPFRHYIGHFYARRARRILPPYVAVLVITGFTVGFGFLSQWYLYLGGMNLMGSLFPAGPPSLVLLWSLAVEEQFYLLWPIIVYLLNRRQLIYCSCTLIALAPILRYVCTPLFQGIIQIYFWLPFRIDTLAMGALVALLWPRVKSKVQSSPVVRPAIATGCAVVIGLSMVTLFLLHVHGVTTFSNVRIGNCFIYVCTLGIVSSMFVLALLGVGKKILDFVLLVWLGRISYSFYLIHLTALTVWAPRNRLLAFALALAYAAVMWFAIERPLTIRGQSREKVLVPAEG